MARIAYHVQPAAALLGGQVQAAQAGGIVFLVQPHHHGAHRLGAGGFQGGLQQGVGVVTAQHQQAAAVNAVAVEQGGNCPLSKPGEIVEAHGVKIIGHKNVAGRLAVDASSLYAKNRLNVITPQVDQEAKTVSLDWEDETVTGTALTRDGAIIHPALTGENS